MTKISRYWFCDRSSVVFSTVALVALLFGLAPAHADTPNQNAISTAGTSDAAGVTSLLRQADQALKNGNMGLALIQLKNAVREAPQDGSVRAQLGVVLLRAGDAASAERELREARVDRGPDGLILPALFQAMLVRGKAKDLLAEFPDPGQTKDATTPDLLRARAVALQTLGQTAEANAAMDRSLALRRDAPGLLSRAQLARQQNDLKLANQLIDEALKMSPTNPDALLLKVGTLRQSGDKQGAMTEADHLLQLSPGNIAARIERIETLIDLKEDAKAKEDVDALLTQSPKFPIGLYYRAVLLARAKDVNAAWQIVRDLPPEFIQSQSGVAVVIAEMAIGSGNVESGGAILSTQIAKNPDNAQARIRLAVLRLQQKNPQDALTVLTPLKDSKDSQALALLADAYLKLRQYTEAIDYLQRADASGGNDLIKRELALTELQTGKSAQGIQELEALAARAPGNLDTAGALIAALVHAGKLDEALKVADKISQNAPKGPLPAFYRGQVLMFRGDLAGAVAAFGQALAADPKFTPALYYRAGALEARGDDDLANRDLQQVLAQDPKNIMAAVKQAEIAARLGQQANVIAYLNHAITLAPSNPLPHLALANYQFLRHEYHDAQTTISNFLKASPDNPDALALEGQIQLASGAKDQAIATYRLLVTKTPLAPNAHMLLGATLASSGDKAGALTELQKAVQLAPTSLQVTAELINLEVMLGSGEKALADARAFASANPSPDVDMLVANTLARLNRNAEAVATLTTSLAAKASAHIAMRLAQLLQSTGDTKKALATLSDWSLKHPNDVEVRREYAGLLSAAGDNVGAQREYEAILHLRPEDTISLNNLAWIIQKQDPKRAVSLASLAAKIAPQSPDVIDTLGWIKYQTGDRQGALVALQRARSLDATKPEIGYHLAVALDANGKRADAKNLLQSILAKNVKFDDVESAKTLLAHW